ncbi:MAG TPA: hypothetical protein VMW07_05200 [Gallionella sp.]|jgi:hypothetical protein|nr:hypothetical protein [Gallionella sp.]
MGTTIADICNRRYAASRNCERVAAQQRGTHRRTPCGCVTVGKTYVHQVLQQHEYEIQILRRNLKHAKPKIIPRNLIWGIDLTGKTDTQGKCHSLFGIIDHGSRALLYALHWYRASRWEANGSTKSCVLQPVCGVRKSVRAGRW